MANISHGAAVHTINQFFTELAGSAEDDMPMLQWQYPVGGIVFYMVSIYVLKAVCAALNTNGESLGFKAFIFLHNLGLCIYSGISGYLSWSLMLPRLQQDGWWAAICDFDGELWYGGMDILMYYFFLSKYYEFFDTWILIVKRKEPSLLQEYHHMGAVLSMWSLVVSRAPMGYWFLLMNSCIHTIMYAYYASSITSITRKIFSPFKMFITQAQMIQFLVGCYIALPIFLAQFKIAFLYGLPESFYQNECNNEAQRAAILFSNAYLVPLLILFFLFYRRTYKKVEKTKRE